MEELYARWPLVALAFLAGGASRGALGFGIPLISIPIVASILGPRLAIPLVAVPTFFANVIDILLLGKAEGRALRRAWVYLAAGALFVPVGSLFLLTVNPRWIRLLVGVVVAAYALFRLLRPAPLRLSRRREFLLSGLVGALAGFLAGAVSMPGAISLVYLSALGLPRDSFIFLLSVLNCLFLGLQVGILSAAGAYPLPVFGGALLAILPAYAGFGLGYLVRRRLAQPLFQRCVLVGIVVLGLNLVARALRG